RDRDGAVFVESVDRKVVFTVPALAKSNPNPPLYQFNEKLVGFFIPPDIDRRVTVQGSVLAIRHDPTLPVVANPEFLIPAGNKTTLLDDLKRLGVTYGSLFPDLAGVATALKDEVGDWDPGLR